MPDPISDHPADTVRGRAVIVQGDARALNLPDESVDLVVTSPPYFGQRDYRQDGESIKAQIGTEETPSEYLANLWATTDEMVRVLKPTGSIWVNLGDKYGSNKSLMGFPWQYALGCIDRGLILRAEVIWAKTNGLPDGARDRVVRRHEQWFHFVRGAGYFAALDNVREPHTDTRKAPRRITGQFGGGDVASHKTDPANKAALLRRKVGDHEPKDPRGKLPGSVWMVPTETTLKVPSSLGVEHFAAFPAVWPLRLIDGWCPEGGVVLDPFGGTGTVAMMAVEMGRTGISVDLSADYCRLAQWRINESGHGAKALAAHRPEFRKQEIVPGQVELWTDQAAS